MQRNTKTTCGIIVRKPQFAEYTRAKLAELKMLVFRSFMFHKVL